MIQKRALVLILISFFVVLAAISGTVFLRGNLQDPYMQQKETIFDISQPTKTEESPLIDWDEYRNGKYGYSVQYPLGWQAMFPGYLERTISSARGDEDLVNISPPFWTERGHLPGDVIISIGVDETPLNSFNELVESIYDDKNEGWCAKDGREINIGDERGFIYECSAHGGEQYTVVHVVKYGFNYRISASYEDKGVPSSIMFKIINTFNFFTPEPYYADTTGWERYIDAFYKYEFLYPYRFRIQNEKAPELGQLESIPASRILLANSDGKEIISVKIYKRENRGYYNRSEWIEIFVPYIYDDDVFIKEEIICKAVNARRAMRYENMKDNILGLHFTTQDYLYFLTWHDEKSFNEKGIREFNSFIDSIECSR